MLRKIDFHGKISLRFFFLGGVDLFRGLQSLWSCDKIEIDRLANLLKLLFENTFNFCAAERIWVLSKKKN